MILKLSFLLVIVNLLVSCNNQSREEVKPDIPATELSISNCYRYTNNKDTVLLKTTNVNDVITGTLSYNYYEKDKSNGKIEGEMKGELLLADYSFFSEGVQSVRQVAFKKAGNNFMEGYGELEIRNGKIFLKNTDSLNFDISILLSKVECEN